MFILKQHQVEAFHAEGLRELHDKIVDHLRAFFPHRCAALSPEALRAEVEEAARRAAAHGIDDERDICAYVDLHFVFGPDFESDPACPWARALTDDEDAAAPGTRVQRALRGALEQLEG